MGRGGKGSWRLEVGGGGVLEFSLLRPMISYLCC